MGSNTIFKPTIHFPLSGVIYLPQNHLNLILNFFHLQFVGMLRIKHSWLQKQVC